ncbi:MAG: FAD-dependent oxidoreductase [bacterium]|nr:FAD-dependent oxidoreductase [bacterium]
MNDFLDMVVIGGGITGLGVAREASKQGLKVALVEKSKINQGTSKNSLRIIHGGLRYLQSLNILRARESILEQGRHLKEYSRYIKPLPCLMPLSATGLKSKYPISLGIRLYNFLRFASQNSLSSPKILDKEFVLKESQILSGLSNTHYLLWQDAVVTDPNDLAQSFLDYLLMHNGQVYEHAQVLKISRCYDSFNVSMLSENIEKSLRTKTVVNATGPFIDSISLEEIIHRRQPMRWVKGFNVVINFQLDPKYAFSVTSNNGRLYFAVPRGHRTAIGTGYIRHWGEQGNLDIPEFEVKSFLEDFTQALNGPKIDLSNIEVVESGILPAENTNGSNIELAGRYQLNFDRGYCEILSTKYTTFGVQAEKIVSNLMKFLKRDYR